MEGDHSFELLVLEVCTRYHSHLHSGSRMSFAVCIGLYSDFDDIQCYFCGCSLCVWNTPFDVVHPKETMHYTAKRDTGKLPDANGKVRDKMEGDHSFELLVLEVCTRYHSHLHSGSRMSFAVCIGLYSDFDDIQCYFCGCSLCVWNTPFDVVHPKETMHYTAKRDTGKLPDANGKG
ncbi:hypothetical protein RF11_05087 [Thelohanellus kitauei]|uniref:Uncharacterized protein n=1 Tax=Thelohanellus kitauei TaxID=669202 RepID=A0A0C2MA37_THEKT|nr:hypothetical protein RF11_05087 [Thelohanellus kitauei]